MGIHKSYAVFGLGRYGLAVAKELQASGADVLAVDANMELIQNAATELSVCKCADVTDPEVVRQLGVSNFDAVIVAIAGNLEASVMAVTLCKDAGVPTVIAKCGSELHRRILLRVGADQVVFPENESGIRLAKNLLSSGFVDIIELSDGISMLELDVRPNWVGKSLPQLELRKKYSINIVAIRRGDKVSTDIDPQAPLTADMQLIVIADVERLAKLK